METMQINNETWVKKSSIKTTQLAEKVDGLKYCVIRTFSAGVHIGYLKSKEGQSVELINSRRLWYWYDANSLSQVAMDGVGDNSNVAMVVPEIILEQVIEIIPCSEKAKANIEGQKEWKK